MRRTGVSSAGRGFGPHDHLCWGYDDPADFHARAVEFLADGVSLGLKTSFVAPGDAGGLTEELSRSAPLAKALREGSLTIESLDGVYGEDEVVDPETQVATYAAATEAALAEGYRGYRVAAEATGLVRTPARLARFTRYEHRIDRYMAAHPFSAMCGYDQRELDEAAIVQLASLHPAASPGATPFRLHPDSDGVLSLSGELDHGTVGPFTLALERAQLLPEAGRRVLIDGRGLEFTDHRNLLALSDAAVRQDVTVVLRTGCPSARRLLELFEVPGVTLERAA
ncbi:Anti-anti-sigma regulatory factor (antagonist of anti-sigma factor) [Amycolatopsis sacchari]|uniref:Anti-anti-sigma regulatory factor (Antagonist of anti-sigma factor) n=1 Tax=Amycolatopsis sacchari TaxID=115433 RepID=A0A1I4C1L8_9PSEU|nr:MEDS domain-containing protein [Amycolatopsis sacchari]SFK74307.1 Anti-anti-sigma regulatory factor (antagonist of anti-sigma factor) [Amycolatopsis sacchari]